MTARVVMRSGWESEVHDALTPFYLRVTTKAEAYAKNYVPVVTGALRESIYSKLPGDGMELGATADYAGYVHDGTHEIKGNPFLLRALLDAIAEETL